jgi:hypothetical protein
MTSPFLLGFLQGNAIAVGNSRTAGMPIQQSDLSCAVSSSSYAAWQAEDAVTPSFPS